jgi:hypothetical protein
VSIENISGYEWFFIVIAFCLSVWVIYLLRKKKPVRCDACDRAYAGYDLMTELYLKTSSEKSDLMVKNLLETTKRLESEQAHKRLQEKYNELLMCVEEKMPGLTRHEQAKNMIISSQNRLTEEAESLTPV